MARFSRLPRLTAARARTLQAILAPALAPFGWAYGLCMRGRAARALSAPGYRPGVPCVSIGNIAWGGTGKTPVTEWLLDWACARGLRAAVLTRGYGGRPPELPYLVTPDSPVAHAGDEPLMLALGHPRARVLVDPVRRRSAAWAERALKPDFFIMDDGFQHLSLRRDRDIVLLRPQDLDADWNRIIPAGSWRESAAALSRASVFLIRVREKPDQEMRGLVRRRLGPLGRPVYWFALAGTGVARREGKQRPTPEKAVLETDVRLEAYLLVSGVGAPEDVRATARRALGRDAAAQLAFPDHHPYSAADAAHIGDLARRHGLSVLTTAKDAVKLARAADFSFYVLKTELLFGTENLLNPDPAAPAPAQSGPVSFPEWWEQAARDLGLARFGHI